MGGIIEARRENGVNGGDKIESIEIVEGTGEGAIGTAEVVLLVVVVVVVVAGPEAEPLVCEKNIVVVVFDGLLVTGFARGGVGELLGLDIF